ncbi:hypothetical protein MBLNU457_4185t2 [Dothideomycetes sp. NU457]
MSSSSAASAAARSQLKAQREAMRASGARKKRPAFNLTCANCRRRKMRCDSGQPGCLICAAYGDTCTYDKTPPVSQVVAMAKRLHELEEVMNQLKLSDNKDIQQILDAAQNSVTAPPEKRSVSQQLSDISSSPREAALRQSESQPRKLSNDSTVSLPGFSELSMCADGQLRYYGSTSAVHQPVASARNPSSAGATELGNDESRSLLVSNASQSRNWEDFALGNASLQLEIPREIIIKLLDTHWTWIQPMFMFTYRPAFMSDMSTGGSYFSPFLLSVICAHSTRFVEKHLADTLVARARILMATEIQKESSIPTIQGLLQLSAREIGQGTISQAWLYSGMAFRMSTDLGLHLSVETISNLGQPLSAQDKEIRNRLSWACFLWDKAMSLYLGRTPTIQEPPSNEPEFLDEFSETEPWVPFFPQDSQERAPVDYPPTASRTISNFTNFCKLCVIVNDIILQLYGKTRPSAMSAFVQKTRERLDAWWKATPRHLQIDVSNPPAFCPPPHILTVCLLHYATIILLHRPLGDLPFTKTALREASRGIEVLLLLLERSFGFTRMTYLMSYCAYTGATVAVEDLSNGLPGAVESVQTFIRALEGARRTTCPVIASSLDIIKMNIAQKCPDKLAMLNLPMDQVVHPSHPGHVSQQGMMPAFPYQPIQMDYSGHHTNVFAVDPTASSMMLNSYPQHFVDMRDEGWIPHMQHMQ